MANNEKTSKRVATIASGLLKDSNTAKKVKSVAASALTQFPDKISAKKYKAIQKKKSGK